jgi:hypothetical protein
VPSADPDLREGRPERDVVESSAGDLVKEAEDRRDPGVLVGDRDVEADDRRLGSLRPQPPGEPGLPVVPRRQARPG